VVTVLLFPGQGAQKVGMAQDIAAAFPAARAVLERIDSRLETKLSEVMWQGPEAELQRTHNTQPAILAHSSAVLAVVQPHLGEVVGAAGHSLGEYSAYVAAGALDAAEAAVLVRRRGTLMFEAGQHRPGAMAAVLGLDAATVTTACAEASCDPAAGVVVAANFNGPDQTVISGDTAAVALAGERCQAAGAKRVLPLKVSGAFHSPLMEPAVQGLRDALRAAVFNEPKFPVTANATGSPVHRRDAALESLAAQVTAPVRWVESMRQLAAAHPGARWLEIGPGSTLSGLLRRIVPDVSCTPLGTVVEVEKWLAQ
jgi:[acyl-carrier-protein] S-malonyltransferase